MRTFLLSVLLLVVLISASCAATATATASSATSGGDSNSEYGRVQRIPLEPTQCDYLVVWLHGLGDTSQGWVGTLGGLALTRPHVCFLLPTARKMFIKAAGRVATAWFDVSDARFRDLKQNADPENVKKSAEYVWSLVRQQQRLYHIGWSRVVFGGFSQGGAMAIYLAMLAPETVRAAIVVGGFLPAQNELLSLAVLGEDYVRLSTRFFFIHGAADTVVKIEHAKHAVQQLERVGVKKALIQFYEDKQLNHGLNDAALDRLKNFIDEHLPPLGDDDF